MTKRRSKLLKPFTKAQFDKLSPAKRRLLIAQDVLTQLDLKMFVAKPGTYYHAKNKRGKRIELEAFDGKDAQKVDPLHELLNSGKISSCHVCAAGAACLSGVRLFDQAKYYDHPDSKRLLMDDTVHEYFPRDMRWRMENWFERSDSDDDWSDLPADKRLRCIYQQIVDNKGEDFDQDGNARWWWWQYVPAMAAKLAKIEQAQKQLDKVNRELSKRDKLAQKAMAESSKLYDKQEALEELINA